MKARPRPGFLLVARREWRWISHDRAALILIFGVPIFCFAVLTAVFSHPVMRELGIVVVDADRSETSRAFVEHVAASPGLSIVERADDLSSAVRAIRSGKAISAIYIPAYFERDLRAQRRPQVVAFYNQQFLTAAGVAVSSLSDSLAAATRRAGTPVAPKAVAIGSLTGEKIVLVNPARNYAQFLLRALLPMVLHVVMAISAGYAVGSEFRRRSVRVWLASAGGDPIVALAGKLTPLLGIFFVFMFSVPLLLEGFLGIQFRGDVLMMVISGVLLIIGYLALGALLQLLVCDLAVGLGLTGLIVSPAFGYAGIGFPTFGMNIFAQFWSSMLPLRWYMAVLLDQAARGLSVADSARPFAALAGLAVLYAFLALLRLAAVGPRLARRSPVSESMMVSRPTTGLAGAFTAEWRRILGTPGAFMLLVVGPLIYGVYYPQPYLNQILRNIPIVVVDNDLSELSRRIVQTLDASSVVRVAIRANTYPEARAALDRGNAFAVVEIPPGTERDVLKGTVVHIPIYADATYLFIFRTMASGIEVAIETLTTELAARGARTDGSLVKAVRASVSPAGGYASYVVPAVFVLILQQLLLIGASLLTVLGNAEFQGQPHTTVLGRGVAHLVIFLPALALYFFVLPRLYGFSTLGQPLQIFALASLFVLATSFMGQAAGTWFKHPETPTLIFLGTSIPQFFLTGFAWPREAIPQAVQAVGYIFPSDFAIDGLVRIEQLGASIWDVAHDWLGLWCLVIIYFALAVFSLYVKRREKLWSPAELPA
jgi:ABC-2 type transport system permease protein